MLFFWTNDAEFRQEGNILKRLHVLAVVLVLLALVVSSVSAHVIIEPPPFPDSAPGGGVSAEEGKASPILFRHGAVIVEGTDGSDPPYSSPIRCRVRWRVSSWWPILVEWRWYDHIDKRPKQARSYHQRYYGWITALLSVVPRKVITAKW